MQIPKPIKMKTTRLDPIPAQPVLQKPKLQNYDEQLRSKPIIKQIQQIPPNDSVLQSTKVSNMNFTAKIRDNSFFNFAEKSVLLKKRQNRIDGVFEVVQKEKFVYLSRFSPVCKSAKWCCLAYFTFLTLTLAMLLANNAHGGLDSLVHIVKMKNVTYPISYYGLNGTALQMDNLELGNLKATINKFPLSLVMDLSDSPEIESFSISEYEVQHGDNGAAFAFEMSNLKRKPFSSQEAWFNFDYWEEPKFKYTGTDAKIAQFLSSTNEVLKIGSFSSEGNNLPLWQLKPPNIKTIQLKLQDWFYFYPLFIKNLPGQTINITNLTYNSELILDINNQNKIKFNIENSSIHNITVLNYNTDKSLNLEMNNSNVTIKFISSTNMYGVSGMVYNSGEIEYQQRQHSITNHIIGNVVFKVKSEINITNIGINQFKLSFIENEFENVSYLTIKDEIGIMVDIEHE